METLTPDQLRRVRDHVTLSGVLDDDLEARFVREMADDVVVKITYARLSFEDAFAKVKAFPAYQHLNEVQEHHRELRRVRGLLKRDTVLAVLLLPAVSALLFAFNRGEAFVARGLLGRPRRRHPVGGLVLRALRRLAGVANAQGVAGVGPGSDLKF